MYKAVLWEIRSGVWGWILSSYLNVLHLLCCAHVWYYNIVWLLEFFNLSCVPALTAIKQRKLGSELKEINKQKKK